MCPTWQPSRDGKELARFQKANWEGQLGNLTAESSLTIKPQSLLSWSLEPGGTLVSWTQLRAVTDTQLTVEISF